MSNNIRLIAKGFDVAPLLASLQAHPELWDKHPMRTEHPDSPHHELSDIWIRYNAWEKWTGDRAAFNAEHESQWYPAADVLCVRPLVQDVMEKVDARSLGGIFITKIPSAAECKPHVDHGWHARTYEKFAVQLQANSGQAFCFEDGNLVTEPGDLFWFDNAHTHWVTNPTSEDRITLIIALTRSH